MQKNHIQKTTEILSSSLIFIFIFLFPTLTPNQSHSFMASTTRVTHCDLRPPKPYSHPLLDKPGPVQLSIPKPKLTEPEGAATNIVLQPRLCTLRSYGSDPIVAVIKSRKQDTQVTDDMSSFFATLSEYIESSKKSQDFEIISGHLAMMVFAATVTVELVTGNSVFRKMDIAKMTEAKRENCRTVSMRRRRTIAIPKIPFQFHILFHLV